MRSLESILTQFSKSWKTCILNLTDEWSYRGFDKNIAGVIYGLGGSDLIKQSFDPLIDHRWYKIPERAGRYEYKLTPLGLELKKLIEERGVS